MGEDLHLPSDEFHAQGPRQTEDLQGHSCGGSPTVAQEQLVPSPPLVVSTTGTSPRADTDAIGTEQAGLSLFLSDSTIILDRLSKLQWGDITI